MMNFRQYMDCDTSKDPDAIKKLLEKHAMKNQFVPDPEFATSPISIKDVDYDFSVDLSLISMVENEPFCGTENDDAIEHMNKLAAISALFSNEKKIQRYYVVKLFPFSLKDDAKVRFNSLSYGSIKSPHELVDVFFAKYFPAHMQHAALQRIYNFKQLEDEHIPKAWGEVLLIS